MSHVVVVATFVASDSNSAELIDIFQNAAAPTRLEDGCESYEIHQDVRTPERVVMLERWTSLEALSKHGKQSHVIAMTESLGKPGLLAERPEIRVLRHVS